MSSGPSADARAVADIEPSPGTAPMRVGYLTPQVWHKSQAMIPRPLAQDSRLANCAARSTTRSCIVCANATNMVTVKYTTAGKFRRDQQKAQERLDSVLFRPSHFAISNRQSARCVPVSAAGNSQRARKQITTCKTRTGARAGTTQGKAARDTARYRRRQRHGRACHHRRARGRHARQAAATLTRAVNG